MAGLRVTRIDHVSVIVTDLTQARGFYRDVLGLKEIPKPRSFDFVALWFDLGGGQTLHLLQKPRADTRSPRHFALGVPDAKAAREHFRECGITTDETTIIRGCDRFFVTDPDGNRVEVIQWLEPYDPKVAGADDLDS